MLAPWPYIVRQAYDPAGELRSARRGPAYEGPGRWGSPSIGATCVMIRVIPRVLWISEWPRQRRGAELLAPVIFAQGVRRSLTLVAHPLGASEALAQIRKEKTEAITDSAQKARDRPDARPLGSPGVRGRPGP